MGVERSLASTTEQWPSTFKNMRAPRYFEAEFAYIQPVSASAGAMSK
jgi:hypothetical protein